MLNFLFTQTPLFFFVQSIWRDEAFSYLVANKSLLQILTLSAHDFSPPLYFYLLHFWMLLFGTSEIALRSLSLIAFFASWYVYFLILDEIVKIKGWKMWLAMGLFALNPFLNYYAFEARMYTLYTFFALASTYFFFKKQKKPYIISSVLGLYNHYFMALVIGVQFVTLFLTKLFNKKERFEWAKAIVISGLFFVPWIVFFLTQHPFENRYWIVNPGIGALASLAGILYAGYEQGLRFFDDKILALSLLIYGIIAAGWLFIRKGERSSRDHYVYFFLLAFLPAVICIVVSYFVPVFLARYLIFATPALLLLIAYFVKKAPVILVVITGIVLVILTMQFNQLQIHSRVKAPINKLMKEIKPLMKPGDLIYVRDELDFHSVEYYLDEQHVDIYGKTYEEVPEYVGKVLMPKDKFVTTLPFYPKKAFIINDDMSYTIQSQF